MARASVRVVKKRPRVARSTPEPSEAGRKALTAVQRADRAIPITKAQRLSKANVPLGDLKTVIAETMQRVYIYQNNAEINATEAAHWIAYDLIYEDGGFNIDEVEMEIPFCKEHR